MNPRPPISSVYRMANDEPPKGVEAERRNREAFASAWQKMGLIVIYPDQVLDDWTRQAFINEAVKQYGQRATTPSPSTRGPKA